MQQLFDLLDRCRHLVVLVVVLILVLLRDEDDFLEFSDLLAFIFSLR